MSKIVNITSQTEKREKLENILKQIGKIKDTLADVIAEYEAENADNETLDMLTEALDALEDASDAVDDTL